MQGCGVSFGKVCVAGCEQLVPGPHAWYLIDTLIDQYMILVRNAPGLKRDHIPHPLSTST